jgi:colanic acid biosynthesis glycosyl transferase WcaI
MLIMKILVYAINYAPELISTGKYTSEMCEWLSARGHEVRVITAQPYYPDWKVFDGYKAWCYRTEIINNVRVMRCPLWVPSKPTGRGRIFHLLSFAVSSFFRLITQITWRPDVIFFVEPSIFCFPNAFLFSKLTGAVPVLHIQDFEVNAAFELGILKSQLIRKILTKFEGYFIKKCKLVSTISPNMQKKLLKIRVHGSKAIFSPNWVDTDLIKPLAGSGKLRKDLNLSDKDIVCFYSGNFGKKQGLEIIIDAADKLKDKQHLVFVIGGAGPYKEKLQQLVSARKITNIIWLPLQPLSRLNELLNLADIHLLPQRKEAADLVMPSKLGCMLASGRPIIATALPNTQLYNIVENTGQVTIPGDVTSFVVAIEKLAGDFEYRRKMGENARKYAEDNLNKEDILNEYEQRLKNLIEG